MENITIQELVDQYGTLNAQSKKLADEAGKVNNRIKEYMKDNGLEIIETTNFKATYIVQERSSTITEKLIERLKALGLTSAIKMIETINEEEVQNMMYDGRLNASQIADCIETKGVEVLRITGVKKGGK